MKKQLLLFCFLLGGLMIISCGKDGDDTGGGDPDECEALDVKFSTDIMPIVSATCAIPDCHEAGFANGDFTAYDGIKMFVDDGAFETEVVNKTMPPDDTLGPESLTDTEIEKIQCWIADGAPNN